MHRHTHTFTMHTGSEAAGEISVRVIRVALRGFIHAVWLVSSKKEGDPELSAFITNKSNEVKVDICLDHT